MFAALIRRIPWLSPKHPLTAREMRRVNHDLPKFFRKLTDFWTTLGYAALLHGAFFILALITYGHFLPALPIILMPFLTPFGTPIGMGILHSILYWAMMIGICNQTTALIARDVESGTWAVLRLTPHPGTAILGAKLRVVIGVWGRVLRTLVVTRVIALILIPAAIYLQHQSSETHPTMAFDFISAFVFLAQPYVDAFLVASLSAVVALLIANPTWAKIGAYGLIATVYGTLNAAGAFWLLLRSPLGGLAGLLVPLGHWAPLVAAIIPPMPHVEVAERVLATTLFYLLLPLLVGLIAVLQANRLTNKVYADVAAQR